MRVGCVFVKPKTAYEMRMSDWSSDVCSSERRLDYVTAATNAAVKHDHSLAAYRLYDFGKNEQGSWCMIQSAAAMIGYNNAVRTAKNSFAGIVWRQNTFDNEFACPSRADASHVKIGRAHV